MVMKKSFLMFLILFQRCHELITKYLFMERNLSPPVQTVEYSTIVLPEDMDRIILQSKTRNPQEHLDINLSHFYTENPYSDIVAP